MEKSLAESIRYVTYRATIPWRPIQATRSITDPNRTRRLITFDSGELQAFVFVVT